MALATSSAGEGMQNSWDSIAASATDSVLVVGVPGRRIRVVAFIINQGDTTPSTVTFNSKGAGAGTPVFPALKAGANGALVLPGTTVGGWFDTNVGEALTVTTGAGSVTGVVVKYKLV